MLLRLKVKGFKNLADVDVRFGPLTCFVGRNGVGKSNLMDAIHFLSLLAEFPVQEAAKRVRLPTQGVFLARDLVLNGEPGQELSFIADMIVPRGVVDDFGRTGQATTTLLRYEVGFRYVEDDAPRLELIHERLSHHKRSEANARLGFRTSAAFRESAVQGERKGGDFISTGVSGEGEESRRPRRPKPDTPQIRLHQDGGSRGQPYPVGQSPRTVLGGTGSIEYPTVLAARREMLSWRFLHLEPSSMRSADPFGDTPHVSDHGGRIAATLDYLARVEAEAIREKKGLPSIDAVEGASAVSPRADAQARIFREACNRLRELDPQVRGLRIDRDEARQQLMIQLQLQGSERWFGPRGISDGTLRFLALTAMQMDRAHHGVLCLEEPENGMHPSRIPALLELLRDFAVDPDEAVGLDNPLRQVVINSHSPEVVKQIEDQDILFVDEVVTRRGRTAEVYAIEGSWRSRLAGDDAGRHVVPRQRVLDFIGGAPLGPSVGSRQTELQFGTAR